MREEAKPTVRSVLCQTHGLRYDPAVATGCVRCKTRGASTLSHRSTGGAGSARLFRLLVALAVLIAALWFILNGGLLSFLGIGNDGPSGPVGTEAYDEGAYADESYEEESLFDEELEDPSPPSGAISGTAEELQEDARRNQERVKAYQRIE